MKNKFIKSTCFLLLIVMMCLTGCSTEKETSVKIEPMEAEESKAVSFNFIGGKDVMPIGVFDGPHVSRWNQNGNIGPNYVTDEYFQMMKDLGINMIMETSLDWLDTREYLIKELNLAEKYGFGVFVGDHNVTWSYEITEEEALQYVSEYAKYPAFCGITLLDEPNTPSHNRDGSTTRNLDMFINLAKVLQYDLDLYCYINLYPSGDWDAKGRENYIEYVNECFDALKPKIYTYDMYPFSSNPDEMPFDRYLWNLDLFRNKAQADGVPFWGYIATGGQWGLETTDKTKKPYFPTEPQFNWNVNTTLAFGAQGMQYYMLFPELKKGTMVTEEWDHYEKGIFGEFGNKTQWYYYVENINKQIAATDDVLMNAVHKGIIVSGDKAKQDASYVECLIESGKFQELQSVTGDALIGCFNYNGKTALYVVNYSLEYAQKLTLDFNANQKFKVVQNAQTSYQQGKSLTLDMAAGEGVLLVVE